MKKLVFSTILLFVAIVLSVGQELIKNGNFTLPENGLKYSRIDSIPNWCTDATTADENGREFHNETNPVMWMWDESKSAYQVIGTVPSTQTTYSVSMDVNCVYTYWADYVTDLYVIFSTFTGTDSTNRTVLDSVKFTHDCATANLYTFFNKAGTYTLNAGNAHAGENLVAEIKIFNSQDFGYGSSYTYLWFDNISITKPGTAIDENLFSALKVFPVPAKSMVTISNNQKIERVTLYDITGKRVKNQLADDTEVEMNISDLSSGVYLLNVYSKGQSITKRVVVD